MIHAYEKALISRAEILECEWKRRKSKRRERWRRRESVNGGEVRRERKKRDLSREWRRSGRREKEREEREKS